MMWPVEPKIEYALTWLLHELDLEDARLRPLRTGGHAPHWDQPTPGYVQAGGDVLPARNRAVAEHIVAWDPQRAETMLTIGRLIIGAAWMAFLPEPEKPEPAATNPGRDNASLAQRHRIERLARRRTWLHVLRCFALQFSDREGFPAVLRIDAPALRTDAPETASLPN